MDYAQQQGQIVGNVALAAPKRMDASESIALVIAEKRAELAVLEKAAEALKNSPDVASVIDALRLVSHRLF